jgi:uncharacterized protein DUF402
MWSSGDVVVLRYRSEVDGRFHAGMPLRVVEHTSELLVAYLAEGTIVARTMLADGRDLRDVPLDERWAHPRTSVKRPWVGNELVLLWPRGRAHSLWVVRDSERRLIGWYVNLEEPAVFGERTISTSDGVLDIWVPAETCEPQWKDEDELAAAVEHGPFTAERAAAIRAEGERVWAERPWPSGWEGWRPPPEWDATELPAGWDAEEPTILRA